MAVLSDERRRELWAEMMRDLSDEREPIAVTKQDLRAAVDALDTWLSTNAATINAAIPQPARGALTASQKARLMMHVIRKRYVVGV